MEIPQHILSLKRAGVFLIFLSHRVTKVPYSGVNDVHPLFKETLGWIRKLSEQEWSEYSLNGEDGVMNAIFSKIGVTNVSLNIRSKTSI